MKNDLISKKDVIALLDSSTTPNEKLKKVEIADLKTQILNMPTAYNVEEIIEQAHQIFEEALNDVLKDIPEGAPYTEEAHRILTLNKKINEVIRSGG